jgi:hypothetical protein
MPDTQHDENLLVVFAVEGLERRFFYFIPTSSISKTRKLFGGMAPLPAPRSP